ncbi:M90 family metallopeptidase [Rhodanobacter sp. L36]|uniref:M90 family metallopeptidase n=1 Tax=Rhodanobacter sp. L36 TaxID=1747221 RepID=UPI00131D26AF|nr:M90 family metallopeptidase [Rhodanobacter sp. L36]
MPERWWHSLRARFETAPIPDPLWRRAVSHCPLARPLPPDQQVQLRHLAALFLSRKQFHALAGVVLDDYWRLMISLQACLPVLQQGAALLRGWREVLVYPGELKVRRHTHDIDGNTQGTLKPLACDIWERGPLVLSLVDVQLDLEQPWDGCNVVVHEMAHKFDMLDGPPDGVPPLTNISRRRWITQFELAYERLIEAANRGDSKIDAHATENPSEYFAVVSELHYSQPALLREVEPEIAELLEDFYGKSPAFVA